MASDYRLDPEISAHDDAAAVTSEDHDHLFVLGRTEHHLPVPMARMVENVLDWEHLPWVHPESFVSSKVLEHGKRWYRARFGNRTDPVSHNQVLVVLHTSERDKSRWSILLEEGPRAGHLVYTHAERTGPEQITTHVTFYAPEKPRNEAVRKAMFEMFKRQYDLIYHQDTGMMRERQDALHRLATRASDVEDGESLGAVDDVMARAPFLLSARGRRVWVLVEDGAVVAKAADCPHRLGLLPCTPDAEGHVVCPLHGYMFDLDAGCSTDGRGLKLARPPHLVVDDGQVWLREG